MKIPSHLISTDFYEAPVGGADTKKAFHAAGKAFLRSLAKCIGNTGSSNVSSCLGGPGVLGEATLHSDKLYIMVFESGSDAGVRVMYRSCPSRQDSVGGANQYVSMKELADSPGRLQLLIADCKRIEDGLKS